MVCVCARTLCWPLAPVPVCLVGRLNVFSLVGNGSSQPFLWTKAAVRECRVVPRVPSAEGSGGVEPGMRQKQLCMA